MTVKEFLDKVEEIRKHSNYWALTTTVHFDYYNTGEFMQWAANEYYFVKDKDGKEIVEEQIDEHTRRMKVAYYNVIACFSMSYEEYNHYKSITSVVEYVERAVASGKMKLDEPIYLMFGQSIESDNLFEIKEILYDYNSVDVYAGAGIEVDEC